MGFVNFYQSGHFVMSIMERESHQCSISGHPVNTLTSLLVVLISAEVKPSKCCVLNI